MEYFRGVQVMRRDPVKSMKNVLAQIDTKAAKLDVGAVSLRAWDTGFHIHIVRILRNL